MLVFDCTAGNLLSAQGMEEWNAECLDVKMFVQFVAILPRTCPRSWIDADKSQADVPTTFYDLSVIASR